MAGGENGRKQIVIRLDKEVVRRVDLVGVEWDTYRSETIERLLRFGLEQAEPQKVMA